MGRGFTLIELMIVIAILAILSTVAIPGFRDVIKNNRLATQANHVVAALGLARSEAMKRGRPVTVCASNRTQSACALGRNWSNGYLVWTDVDNSGGLTPADILHRHSSLPSGLMLTGTASRLVFTPQGAIKPLPLAGSTIRLDVCDDRPNEVSRRITVQTTGRPALTQTFNCA